MRPFILGLESYVVMAILGGVVFIVFTSFRLNKNGMSYRMAFVVTLSGYWISAIGGRILYAFHYPDDPISVMEYLVPFTRNGFAVYGGLILGGIWIGICSKFRKESFAFWMDQFMPGILIGLAIGRIGCFLGGCCYGKVWGGPWAVHFPYGSEPHKWQLSHELVGFFEKPLGMHPTQLYEMFALILIVSMGYYVERNYRYLEGRFFYLGLGGYSFFRLVNLMFRAEPSGYLPWAFYPILYGFLINIAVLGVAIGVIQNETNKNTKDGALKRGWS